MCWSESHTVVTGADDSGEMTLGWSQLTEQDPCSPKFLGENVHETYKAENEVVLAGKCVTFNIVLPYKNCLTEASWVKITNS